MKCILLIFLSMQLHHWLLCQVKLDPQHKNQQQYTYIQQSQQWHKVATIHFPTIHLKHNLTISPKSYWPWYCFCCINLTETENFCPWRLNTILFHHPNMEMASLVNIMKQGYGIPIYQNWDRSTQAQPNCNLTVIKWKFWLQYFTEHLFLQIKRQNKSRWFFYMIITISALENKTAPLTKAGGSRSRIVQHMGQGFLNIIHSFLASK